MKARQQFADDVALMYGEEKRRFVESGNPIFFGETLFPGLFGIYTEWFRERLMEEWREEIQVFKKA